MTVAATPEQLCRAKREVAVERRRLAGVEQLHYTCSGQEGSCSGCSYESVSGVTLEQTRADMEEFMDMILSVRRDGTPSLRRTVSFIDPGSRPSLLAALHQSERTDTQVTESSPLSDLISSVRAEKRGDLSFALFSLCDGEWRAEVGNRSQDVMLGEADGEHTVDAQTPEAAVWGLLLEVRRAQS